MGRARVILRNIGANFAGQGIKLAVTLVTVPLLVAALGATTFGALTLVWTVLSFTPILDFGLSASIIREIAACEARGDRTRQAQVMASAAFCYLGLGALGATVVILAAPAIVGILEVPPALLAPMRLSLRIGAAAFAVRLPLSAFAALPAGLQRFDVLAKRQVVASTVALVAQAALATAGYGLVTMVEVALLCELAGDLALLRWARRRLGLSRAHLVIDRSVIRSLWSFGAMKTINQLATMGMFQGDKLLIGAFLPIEAVAYYSVPLDLAQRLETLRGSVSSAYYPAACNAIADRDRAPFLRLYLAANRFVALLSFPVGCGLAVLAAPFLRAWINDDMARHGGPVLALLASAYTIASLANIPAITADAAGRPGLTAAFSVGSTLFHLSTSVLLIPRLGILGAALATAANALLVSPLFVQVVNRVVVHIRARHFFGHCIARPLLASTLMAVLLLLLPAPASLLAIASRVVLGAFLYGAMVIALRGLVEADWTLLRSSLDPADRQ